MPSIPSGRQIAGKFGSMLSTAAKTTGVAPVVQKIAPNLTVASSLQNYGGNKSGQGFVWVPKASASETTNPITQGVKSANTSVINTGTSNSLNGWGTIQGNPMTTGGGTYAPSTGGQSVGGGDGGGGGFDYGSDLRAAYDRSRQALEGLLPTYDADFANYKTSVEGAINDARNTLGTQKADVTKRYGDSLKNLLNTSKDLRQRTQSTFSGLGTLDSSAYGDELIKQEQADKEGVGSIDLAQNRDITELDNTFNTYERDQKNKLNSYQTDIDRAKQGVRQAIANGDIEQAQTLANYAQQVQSNIDNLKLSLISAQASGTDVMGSLRKINGVDFNNAFGQALGNRYNSALSRYVIPSGGATGSGYIASGKSQDEQRRLLGMA